MIDLRSSSTDPTLPSHESDTLQYLVRRDTETEWEDILPGKERVEF